MLKLKIKIYAITIFLFCLRAESQSVTFQKADSLYFACEWSNAANMFEQLLKDTSTNSIEWQRMAFCYSNLGELDQALKDFKKSEETNPPAPMLPYLYSRMAKIYGIKTDHDKTLEYLDKAVHAGYSNLHELDSAKEFSFLRSDAKFQNLRNETYNILYPCYTNLHTREFDFWSGEWNVYATGTQTLVGHSVVQIISGGCALLENWDSPLSTGKSINFIDPNTNKWKQCWSGSYANGNQEFVNGEYKDSAMRFEFETKDGKGNKIIGRFIFYNQGPNQVRQFNETSNDNGKTWTTSYDFTYVRKK